MLSSYPKIISQLLRQKFPQFSSAECVFVSFLPGILMKGLDEHLHGAFQVGAGLFGHAVGSKRSKVRYNDMARPSLDPAACMVT